MSEKHQIDLHNLSAPKNEEQALSREAVLKVMATEGQEKTEKSITNEDMDEALKAFDALIEMAESDNDDKALQGKYMVKIFALSVFFPGIIQFIQEAYANSDPKKKETGEYKPLGQGLKEALLKIWPTYKKTLAEAENNTAEAEIKRLIQKAEELDK